MAGKRVERVALAEILEYAKACRDFCDSPANHVSWCRVVDLAYEALGKPSIADIDEIRKDVVTPRDGPSPEFIEKALAAEDDNPSFSVGGFMVE